MCTKNGSYCENEKQKREKVRGSGCVQRMEIIVKRKGGGVQGRCEQRSEAFVKIILFFFFLGGGGGGGGAGASGQGGCERRSEVFVKIQTRVGPMVLFNNAHLTIDQVMPRYKYNNEKQEA